MRYRKNIDNIGYIDICGKKKTQFTCHFVIVHARKAYARVNKKNKRKKVNPLEFGTINCIERDTVFGQVICYDVCDFFCPFLIRLKWRSAFHNFDDCWLRRFLRHSYRKWFVWLLGEEACFFVLFKVVYTIRWFDFKCHIKFVVLLALVFTFFLLSRHVWSSLVRNSAHYTVFTSPF